MTGKIIAITLAALALIAGGAMYYLQVYAYYEDVDFTQEMLRLTPVDDETPQAIPAAAQVGIDADSSPLRFRACFETSVPLETLRAEYATYPNPVPLTAPGWFDCFDAETIAGALERGEAEAFLGEKNIAYGVDRVVAVYEDGRAYAWHQLNNCGETDYAGNPVGEECPPREDFE
ncbi:DUF6446 family protein [Tranquillimonas alkanivorans]|uniref:Histidine kinase n=1 Tax=Tranquillimonas alkanivorans TaxID=441119 RepID=A0A1I5KKB3_9RHOB|nr:DUF6446 family protein [Tranquillimonas alkanivorans]SFO85317.1 hypothetical protein SAMN04488047_101157 [Tranquillimonas alkanivorans]